jgi:hypothetical protein
MRICLSSRLILFVQPVEGVLGQQRLPIWPFRLSVCQSVYLCLSVRLSALSVTPPAYQCALSLNYS